MIRDKFKALANTFPTLREVTNPEDCAVLIAQGPYCSSGKRAAAQFMLHLWGSTEFDLRHSWGCWDEAHRAAFVAWVNGPEGPVFY